jgi:hypothetical protein
MKTKEVLKLSEIPLQDGRQLFKDEAMLAMEHLGYHNVYVDEVGMVFGVKEDGTTIQRCYIYSVLVPEVITQLESMTTPNLTDPSGS